MPAEIAGKAGAARPAKDMREALQESRGRFGANQLLLGHASIQATERYLGTEQALAYAVNDAIGLDLS